MDDFPKTFQTSLSTDDLLSSPTLFGPLWIHTRLGGFQELDCVAHKELCSWHYSLCCCCPVSQSCPTLCDPHGLQHVSLPCLSLSLRICSNSCPLSRWHHLTICLILCHPLLLLPSVFPSIRIFSNELALHIRWPKYWGFSFCISSSSEYSGLISFRTDWFDDLLAVQGTFKSLL